MNPSQEPVTQRELDRLVDGEISPPEYRQLLTRVEQSPDGWRQCALAFLEAQALREELPWAMRMGNGVPVEAAPISTATRWAASRRRVFQMLALAACVLVAFGLGRLGQFSKSWKAPTQPAPAPTIIATNPAPQPIAPQPVPRPQFVYVNQWDGQSGSEMPIPVDTTKTFDPSEPWQAEWGLSAYELQRLQDEGHRLETQNHLIPVSLDSGEHVVVPMQEIILRRPPAMPFH